MGNIDDLYRKYAVKVNNGSGCLFQPDISKQPKESKFTYVLTAKHNIKNEDKTEIFPKGNIEVYRGNEQNPGNELKVLEVFHHRDEGKDAAILKVDYVDDNINLYYTSCQRSDSLRFFGYPIRREKELKKNTGVMIKTAGVNCQFDMEHQDKRIEIVPKKTQFGYDGNAHEHIKGFSGCGVFKEVKNDILLVGILSRLGDQSGAGDNILILPIDYFKEIISQHNRLLPLKPKHLSSFKGYKNEICKGYGTKLIGAKVMLEFVADGVIGKKITPMLIIEQFQEKLCVPNNKDWLNDRALWSGWLELLTYMALLLEEEIKSDELDFLDELLKIKKMRIYYNNNEEDWHSFLRMILEQNPGGLKNTDYVITLQKSKDFQFSTKVNSKTIVPQIAKPSTSWSGSGISIIGSRKPNKYIFIHPQEFKEKIKDSCGNLKRLGPGDKDRIIKELKDSIKRAFSND